MIRLGAPAVRNKAHDPAMSAFGGICKGEHNRIKHKVLAETRLDQHSDEARGPSLCVRGPTGTIRPESAAPRSSGSSIRGEQPSRRGNKQLKRAFFLSAFAALADPASRTYYDKKISQGKHHTQALLCLARRRADVLFAMLRDGTFYDPQPAPAG